MKKITLGLLFFVIIILLTGCPDPEPVSYEYESMDEIEVSDDFSYRTIQKITIDIDMDQHPLLATSSRSIDTFKDYVTPAFSILAVDSTNTELLENLGNNLEIEEAAEEGEIYPLGSYFLGNDLTFSKSLSIPMIYDQIIIDFKAQGLPKGISVDINGDQASFTYVATIDEGTAEEGFTSKSSRSKVAGAEDEPALGDYTKNGYNYISKYNNYGVPTVLSEKDISLTESLLNNINASLPEYFTVQEKNPDFLNNANLAITGDDPANVWVTFVNEGAGYLNSLGFIATNDENYPDPGNKASEIEDLTIIFPNASLKYSGGMLQSGDTVYIGQFDPGTTIYWALIANGWYSRTAKNRDGNNTYFSNNVWNPEYDIAYTPGFVDYDKTKDNSFHSVLLQNGTGDNTRFVVGFEDLNRSGNSDDDFNDLVFIVTVDPITAVAGYTEEEFERTVGTEDSDEDGITDSNDAFPENAELSAEQNYFGIVAFEDQWPYKGDYDFNDLVASYSYKIRTDSNNYVRSFQYEIEVRAIGAGNNNGLYLKMNAPISSVLTNPSDDIRLLSDEDELLDFDQVPSEKLVAIPAVDTVENEDSIVIKLFQHIYNEVYPHTNGTQDPGEGTTILNTQPFEDASHRTDPVTFTGSLYFDASAQLEQSDLGELPLDLFLLKKGNEQVEIHLPDVPPSGLTTQVNIPSDDPDVHDASDPSNGKFYITANNLPWALHIPMDWNYPIEKTEIIDAYKNFAEWAVTKGSEKADWYTPEVENVIDTNLYSYYFAPSVSD